MAQYKTTFAGETTGAASVNFTNRYDTATGVTVENPALDEHDDRVLQFASSGSGDIFQSADSVDGDADRAESEILVRYQNASDRERNVILRLRASGASAAAKTCYDAYINSDDLAIVRWDAGSGSILASEPSETYAPFLHAGDTFSYEENDEWHWCRFRVSGVGATVTLKAKWWVDGQPEPDVWGLNYDDTSASRITAAGWSGVAKRDFTGNSYVDAVNIATNGDTAESPPVDTSTVIETTGAYAQVITTGNTTARVAGTYLQVLVAIGGADNNHQSIPIFFGS